MVERRPKVAYNGPCGRFEIPGNRESGKVYGELISDAGKGELRVFGTRVTAIDAQALCNHLDSLVGAKVAEVIMHNLEYRDGKLDAAKVRAEKPQASLGELIEDLARGARLSGLGVPKVTLPENAKEPIEVQIVNPCVTGSSGAAKSFAFSWWAGVLTTLFGREMDVQGYVYYEDRNMTTCRIVARD